MNVEAFSITLPAEQGSVSRARAFVARAVADHVDDPSALVLMAGELVTNVVDHVGSELTLTCERDQSCESRFTIIRRRPKLSVISFTPVRCPTGRRRVVGALVSFVPSLPEWG